MAENINKTEKTSVFSGFASYSIKKEMAKAHKEVSA